MFCPWARLRFFWGDEGTESVPLSSIDSLAVLICVISTPSLGSAFSIYNLVKHCTMTVPPSWYQGHSSSLRLTTKAQGGKIKQEKAEGRERRAPATTTANPLHSRTVGPPSLGLRSPPTGGKGPLQSHSICFSAKMVLGFVVYWFTCFALEAGFFSGRVV